MGDLNRLRYIASVLYDAGFSELMNRMRMRWYVSFVCRVHCWFRKKCSSSELPRNLRESFEKLGPSFMKLGQDLSMRPDFIPEPYIKELSKLQDKAPALSFETVKSVVEAELKKPLKKVFLEFDPLP